MKYIVALLCVLSVSWCTSVAQVRITLVESRAYEQVQVAALQTIREAKKQSFGTVISVAGRVSVANEFGGPLYLQDETGGIAVFDPTLHAAVAIGDSIAVTGPYTEFGNGGTPGEGLGQISGQGVAWEIISTDKRVPVPKTITIADINEEREGELVRVLAVQIGGATGNPRAFQPNKNYDMSDASGTAQLRIDNTTNLVGATIPEGNITITGVVGQYLGTHQLLPRFTGDVGADQQSNPGDTVPKDKTFDMATWNLKWFGDPNNEPTDDTLQLRNVIRVIDSLDADIIGLQEVVSAEYFQAILDSLPRYGGLFSYRIGQPQKLAWLFKQETVDSIGSAHVLQYPGTWGNGRYPLYFVFDATVQGVTKRMHAFLIHAKATGDKPADDYQQRDNDARALYNFINTSHTDDNVVVLGDFNDDVDVSTYNNQPSPYKNFVDDTQHYTVITKSLSDRGVSSYTKGNVMLDHIIVSNELSSLVFTGAEKIENPSYIGSYISTTSDHYPVLARLFLQGTTSVANSSVATNNTSLLVTPNPVGSQATIEYSLTETGRVRLDILDAAGRILATVVNAVVPVGRHIVSMPSLPAAGVYYCRLHTRNGIITTPVVFVR